MTEFAKTVSNRTRWLSVLSQLAYADPVKPWRCIAGLVEPVGGINKDVCGARLLPVTVSAYAANYNHFCHLIKTQHCCLCPCERYNPPPTTHPHHHLPHPLPPAHPPSTCPHSYTCYLWNYSSCEKLLKMLQC